MVFIMFKIKAYVVSVLTFLFLYLSTIWNLVESVSQHSLICLMLGKKMFEHVSRGTRTWVVMLTRLLMFTTILLPGWYKMLKFWIFSPLVIRNLEYGQGAKKRNLLDVYLPPTQQNTASHSSPRCKSFPVVIFFSGGAWIIGYKLWSCLVGRALSKLGILTIVPGVAHKQVAFQAFQFHLF